MTTSPAAAFFDSVHAAFDKAALAAGSRDVHIRLGGHLIRLRFAGDKMAPLIRPAFEHAEVPPPPSEPPALTICAWDSVSTRGDMPAPPWPNEAYTTRGDVTGYDQGPYLANFRRESLTLSLLDLNQSRAIYWTRDAAGLPFFESAAPFLRILHWWMHRRGLQVAHGAGVGRADGGVFLVGRGGSGKSTTALACLDAGLLFAGDDYCLLDPSSPPSLHSLFGTAKLRSSSVKMLPNMKKAVANLDRFEQEKSVLFLARHWPERMASRFPLRAVLAPVVTEKDRSTLTPTSAAAALTALAPSTVFQLPGADKESFDAMAAVVKKLPCFRLDLGADVAQIPSLIDRLLATLRNK